MECVATSSLSFSSFRWFPSLSVPISMIGRILTCQNLQFRPHCVLATQNVSWPHRLCLGHTQCVSATHNVAWPQPMRPSHSATLWESHSQGVRAGRRRAGRHAGSLEPPPATTRTRPGKSPPRRCGETSNMRLRRSSHNS